MYGCRETERQQKNLVIYIGFDEMRIHMIISLYFERVRLGSNVCNGLYVEIHTYFECYFVEDF
jgi:hypothetical protein